MAKIENHHDLHASVNDIKTLIMLYINTKKPLMIHGAPGIGKSDIVHQVGQELDRPVIDFRASLAGSEDIKGYPYLEAATDLRAKINLLEEELEQGTSKKTSEELNKEILALKQESEKQVMKFAIASDLPRDPNSKAILFLDEINLAPPSTQAALYQLILNRRIGEYQLPDGVDIIAAGNRTEDRGNIHEMSKPLDNRFGHVVATVNTEEWLTWAYMNKVHPSVISFVKSNPQYLNAFDPDSPSHAFATPRSWATLSKLIYAIESLKSMSNSDTLDLVRKAAATSVGVVLAEQFKAWTQLTVSLPSPKEICDGLNPKMDENIQLGLRYALVSNCLYHLVSSLESTEGFARDSSGELSKTFKESEGYKKWLTSVDNYLKYTIDNGMSKDNKEVFGAEYFAMFINILVKQNKMTPNMKQCPHIGGLLKKYAPELRAVENVK